MKKSRDQNSMEREKMERKKRKKVNWNT